MCARGCSLPRDSLPSEKNAGSQRGCLAYKLPQQDNQRPRDKAEQDNQGPRDKADFILLWQISDEETHIGPGLFALDAGHVGSMVGEIWVVPFCCPGFCCPWVLSCKQAVTVDSVNNGT